MVKHLPPISLLSLTGSEMCDRKLKIGLSIVVLLSLLNIKKEKSGADTVLLPSRFTSLIGYVIITVR